jgi:hypothetical protein
MTDYLCTEGQRLFDEWDNLCKADEEKYGKPWCGFTVPGEKINAAWTAYQDHRAACKECAKIIYKTVGGHDD